LIGNEILIPYAPGILSKKQAGFFHTRSIEKSGASGIWFAFRESVSMVRRSNVLFFQNSPLSSLPERTI
jgi:hypothetical protein